MRLAKRLGVESKLGKSFGGEAFGRFMSDDEDLWMAMFAAPFFFFFSSSLESLSLDTHSSPR